MTRSDRSRSSPSADDPAARQVAHPSRTPRPERSAESPRGLGHSPSTHREDAAAGVVAERSEPGPAASAMVVKAALRTRALSPPATRAAMKARSGTRSRSRSRSGWPSSRRTAPDPMRPASPPARAAASPSPAPAHRRCAPSPAGRSPTPERCACGCRRPTRHTSTGDIDRRCWSLARAGDPPAQRSDVLRERARKDAGRRAYIVHAFQRNAIARFTAQSAAE